MAEKDYGYQYVDTNEKLSAVTKLPVLGLFSLGNLK